MRNDYHFFIPEYFHHLEKKADIYGQSLLLPFSPAPGKYFYTSCLYEFSYLDISYKWNHKIHELLCLLYLFSVFSKCIHVVECISTPFLFWTGKYLIVWIFHFPFIHSSVDGHLGCFHMLAIIKNATINIGVHLSFWIGVFVSFGYIPRSGIAGSYGSSMFSVLRNLHTVLHSAAPIYIPTKSVLGFPFLHILTNICYLCSFWW